MMQEIQEAAPGGGYCGAGSCGIEAVNENSTKGQEVKEKLNAKSGDTLVKDTERSCKSCKTIGNVYYVYNATKVNKLCDTCGATNVKKSKPAVSSIAASD